MAVFRRGSVWWYEFRVRGQRVRESTHSRSKTLARAAERERRRRIAEGISYIARKRTSLFSIHTKEWTEEMQPHWRDSTRRVNGYAVRQLNRHFGAMLATDISASDIRRYQARRHADGVSANTINMEVGSLRAVMRRLRLWANLQPDVRMLRARTDIGRALDDEEQRRLLAASKKSRSHGLYLAVLLSMDTGLRNAELRALRWRAIDGRRKLLRVEKAKTAGGEGREIPLTPRTWAALRAWKSEFPEARGEHFVFPAEKCGWPAKQRRAAVDPAKAMGSWGTSWTTARKTAEVECRWHDLRHTFASRLAEQQVSDSTLQSLMGHMSVKMKERYSHTRLQAKRNAVAGI